MKPKPGFLSADYKVVGGKLLRVRLTVAESTEVGRVGHAPCVIDTISIFGDFFMHPEESIEELERLLTGAPLNEAALTERVQTFFDGDVQVIGAGVEDFVHVILKAA